MKNRLLPSKGFTLVELLVVMTIIAVLAAGVLVGGQAAIRNARRLQAKNIAVSLAGSVANYRSEYMRYPFPGGNKKEQMQSDATFISNLTGKDDTLNKKRINFLDGIPQAKGNPPAGGLSVIGSQSSVFDPYGNYYDIYIDHDGDDEITDPEGGGQPLSMKIGVISKGEDGMLSGQNPEGKDATKDNCKSW